MTSLRPPGPADCMAAFARQQLLQDKVVNIACQEALQLADDINNARRPPEDIAKILRSKATHIQKQTPALAAFMFMTADNLDGCNNLVHWWQRD